MGAIDKAMSEYLALLDYPSGVLAHIGTILNMTAVDTYQTQMSPNKAMQVLDGSYVGSISIAADIFEALNNMYKYVMQPNIDGITVFAESEKCSRQADVSERIVLSIDSDTSDVDSDLDMITSATVKPSKKYIVDNNVPRLRTWTLSGRIMSTEPSISAHTVLKSDIMLKVQMLDAFMITRRPVLYKTHDCLFHKVLITSFDYEYTPDANNGVKVDITLKEYKTVNVTGNSVKKSIIQGLYQKEV